jgi:GNAT superfamily N-acetyltransferase
MIAREFRLQFRKPAMNIRESTSEERELIDAKLVEFNKANVPFQQKDAWVDLSHVLRDEAGQVIAGINATLYCWNVMYVDVLYVDDVHRGKGFGKRLLDQAEAKAKNLGGYMSHLDTFDWQAKDFYERQGYVVFGVLENCPPGHSRHYMKKVL